MSHNFFDIIVLIGTFQGLITAGILFGRKPNPTNRYMAWILVLFALASLNIYLLNAITYDGDWFAILSYCVPLVIIFPMGPLVYAYACSFDRQKAPLSRWHFHAFWLDLLPSISFILFFMGLVFGIFEKSQFSPLDAFIDHYNKYMDIPRWLSLTGYIWFAWQAISKATHKHRKWARHFVLGFALFQAIWLIFLIPYIIPSLTKDLLDSFNWYPVYVPIVILVYWLGFNALMRRNLQPPMTTPPDEAQKKKTLDTLVKLMEDDQLYLDPALRLDNIVAITRIPQKTISSVLNQLQGKSFNRFVNEYRVAAVKKKLLDPSFDHLTITGIGLECGFNSQATFQRTFKELEGETPRSYRTKNKPSKNTHI